MASSDPLAEMGGVHFLIADGGDGLGVVSVVVGALLECPVEYYVLVPSLVELLEEHDYQLVGAIEVHWDMGDEIWLHIETLTTHYDRVAPLDRSSAFRTRPHASFEHCYPILTKNHEEAVANEWWHPR